MTGNAGAKTITEHELEQCQRANQTGRQPVVFVHGLWLLSAAGTGGRPCSRSRAMWP
jgi:non-heme chloroperoxidase